MYTYLDHFLLLQLDEVGRILSNLCNIVPGGMVVFLPSYKYEITVNKHLAVTGILKKLSTKKRIFREPKLASEVNTWIVQCSSNICLFKATKLDVCHR